MTQSKLLAEIKGRVEKATPGTWTIEPRDIGYYPNGVATEPVLTQEKCINDTYFLGAHLKGPEEPGRGDFTVADAWFIANAPTDIKALLQIIEVQQKALEFYAEGQKILHFDGNDNALEYEISENGELSCDFFGPGIPFGTKAKEASEFLPERSL
jgi:hypothetical protein